MISVENGLVGADADPSMVYWTVGAEAACAVNKSLTNTTYTGEYTPNVDFTQTQLEKAIQSGELMFHRVGDEVRVLTDINTFVSVTDTKSADFAGNQVVRVLDQIANDIASIFNTKYLGKVQNDAAGRVSLWQDIVSHHNQLQTIRARTLTASISRLHRATAARRLRWRIMCSRFRRWSSCTCR